MVTPSPACFFTRSVPPLPKTALRSHTLSTPVTLLTKAEGVKSPSTAPRARAENVSSVRPRLWQKARSPGSSRFRSMLHTLEKARGWRPLSSRSAAKARSSAAAGVSLRHPTPSTATAGISRRASPASRRRVSRASQSPSAARATPSGGWPAMGQGLRIVAVSPERTLEEKRTMASGLSTRQFCRLAHSSTAKIPRTSVAVVMTAVPPRQAATRRARSLAPPRWPLRMGIAKRPVSSTTTTAGSLALWRTWGATARTAMPAAPKKTRASAWEKPPAVHSARPWGAPQRAASPPKASASVRASSSPRSVKARSRRVIGTPPGRAW